MIASYDTSFLLLQANLLQRHPLAVFHRYDLHRGKRLTETLNPLPLPLQ